MLCQNHTQYCLPRQHSHRKYRQHFFSVCCGQNHGKNQCHSQKTDGKYKQRQRIFPSSVTGPVKKPQNMPGSGGNNGYNRQYKSQYQTDHITDFFPRLFYFPLHIISCNHRQHHRIKGSQEIIGDFCKIGNPCVISHNLIVTGYPFQNQCIQIHHKGGSAKQYQITGRRLGIFPSGHPLRGNPEGCAYTPHPDGGNQRYQHSRK